MVDCLDVQLDSNEFVRICFSSATNCRRRNACAVRPTHKLSLKYRQILSQQDGEWVITPDEAMCGCSPTKSTESWPTKLIKKHPRVSVVVSSTKHEKSAPVDTSQCRIFESGHFTKLPSPNQGRKSTMFVNCTGKISNVLFPDSVLFLKLSVAGKP